MMLHKLSPISRLSLCLLLSTGLHGGLAFYDGTTIPLDSSLTHVPVSVTLLPTVDMASLVPHLQEPAPTGVAAHAAVQAAVTPSEKKLPRVLAKQPPLAPPAIEANAKASPEEKMCVMPQAVVPDDSLVVLASLWSKSEPVAAGSSDRTEPAKPPRIATASLTEDVVATEQPLVEATPNYRSNPLPDYPLLARQRHWQGVVWLLVDVSSEGSVADLKVEQSCGHRVLDRAASRTVRRWQFSPAKRAGLPVSSQVRIPVRFHLEDS
jgi:protein TonB